MIIISLIKILRHMFAQPETVPKININENQILKNVYFDKGNGKTTEIDMLIVCEQGIIVIEEKKYNGNVYGSEHNDNWYQYLNNQKYSFYNPIMQNRAHINALKTILSDYTQAKYFSIVLFSGNAKLKINLTDEPEAKVISNINKNFANYINNQILKNSKIFETETVSAIMDRLKKERLDGDKIKDKHIELVKEIIETCPVCKVKLVKRKSRYNNDFFYGCPNYPHCKFTKPINKTENKHPQE